MARRWQEKGQTGKFAEVSITETVRQASRRVESPRGRRAEDSQHFRGAEGRRAHGWQREGGQTHPEQGKKGVPRKLRGGRWGCPDTWGVHRGQAAEARRRGLRASWGVSWGRELRSVGGQTLDGKDQRDGSTCACQECGQALALPSWGHRGGHSEIQMTCGPQAPP